jgi:hypothetical protein
MIRFKDFLEQNTDAVLIRTSYRTDLDRMRRFLEEEVRPLTKVYQGGKTWHGGWSIQSNDGTVMDGWQPGGSLVKRGEDGIVRVDQEARKVMFPHGQEFRTPTPLCKDIAAELILELESTGFTAKRTRFAELEPEGVDRWHRDSTNRPTWRGHIVIETNPDTHFWWRNDDHSKDIKYHIPADGYLYMVRVDMLHRITNFGKNDRVHILTDSKTRLDQCQLWVEPLAFLAN